MHGQIHIFLPSFWVTALARVAALAHIIRESSAACETRLQGFQQLYTSVVWTLSHRTLALLLSYPESGARRPMWLPCAQDGSALRSITRPVVLRQSPHEDKSMNLESTIPLERPASRDGSVTARDSARDSRACGRMHGFIRLSLSWCWGSSLLSPEIGHLLGRALQYRAVVTGKELSRPCFSKRGLIFSRWSGGL
jgi:hypothetical protein